MGYDPKTPQTPGRRPLVRQQLNNKTKPSKSEPSPPALPLNTCNEENHDSNEKLVAVKISLNEQNSLEHTIDKTCHLG